MTKRVRLFIAAGAVVAVIGGAGAWMAFSGGDELGESAAVAESLPQAKVAVSVVVSADARRLVLEIDWLDEQDAIDGVDRFTARVVGGSEELESKTWEASRPDVDGVTFEFTAGEANILLAAVESGDAVVAVSHQFDSNLGDDSRYEINHVTVVHIPAPTAATSGFKDCSNVSMGPGGNLSGCDLFGANLGGANLSGASLDNANLNSADMSGANLTGANLSGANLTTASLAGANFTGANLTGANLAGAYGSNVNMSDANLASATMTGGYWGHANWANTNLTNVIW